MRAKILTSVQEKQPGVLREKPQQVRRLEKQPKRLAALKKPDRG